jgi:hypothetical protein
VLAPCPSLPGGAHLGDRLIDPARALHFGEERGQAHAFVPALPHVEQVVEGDAHRRGIGPVGAEGDSVPCALNVGHVRQAPVGRVSGAGEVVDEDRPPYTEQPAKLASVGKFPFERVVVGKVLARVRFPDIDEDGLHAAVGVLLR